MMDAQARDPALQDLQSWMRERRGELFRWTESPDIPAENNLAERGVRGLCIARKTSFGGQSEDALWVRGVNQSVLESLALLYDDPVAALAEALDLYAKTGSKARVRDFLFPKVMPSKRPGNPVRGTEAGGDALGIQAAARGAAASARAAGWGAPRRSPGEVPMPQSPPRISLTDYDRIE